MFVLKILHDTVNNVLRPDPRSIYGGSEIFQVKAFEHLFPNGYCCSLRESELLFYLIEIHGWDFQITQIGQSDIDKDERLKNGAKFS